MPIVESALGAWRAYDIAAAHPSVVALAIGLEDYTADSASSAPWRATESFWARCQVVNGARAAGVQPIDTVFSDVTDMDGLRASVVEAKGLGLRGQGVHPPAADPGGARGAGAHGRRSRRPAHRAAFEDAERRGLGVVSLGSKMIDAPVVKRALATVDMAVTGGPARRRLARRGRGRGARSRHGLVERKRPRLSRMWKVGR